MAETPKVRWWKRSRMWRRLGSASAMFSVASTAAVLSWGHIVHAVITYGHQGVLAGYLYPVSIDGMMIVGVTKAADNRADGRRVGFWPRLCTWAGGLQSIAAQILSAWPYGWVARAIAVIPSSSLIIVVETMSRRSKKDPRAQAQAEDVDAAQAAQEPAVSPVPAPAAPDTPVPAPEAPAPVTVTVEPITTASPVDVDVVEGTIEEDRPKRRPRRPVGYPGTGASDAAVEAARVALTAASSTASSNGKAPAFVEPS